VTKPLKQRAASGRVIFTRLHRLADMVGDELPAANGRHYVITDNLLAALTRDDVQRSIGALIEANMARLPFPTMLVEFSITPGVTRFVWLREVAGGLEALTAMLAGAMATMPVQAALVTIVDGGLRVERHADERDGQAVALGAAFALLMLNIKGVEKQHIDPVRLNQARLAVGRAPVPAHVLMKIGVVYDRHGRPVAGGGLKVVYLRAGHMRQQAVGPGWKDHKPVYIAPQLVNYRDGDEAPSAEKLRIVRMN
jgi:hypothetical protein